MIFIWYILVYHIFIDVIIWCSQDGSGTIDKDELRELFIDMFPHFHKNMLERYVTDEFRAADTDFSAGSLLAYSL